VGGGGGWCVITAGVPTAQRRCIKRNRERHGGAQSMVGGRRRSGGNVTVERTIMIL